MKGPRRLSPDRCIVAARERLLSAGFTVIGHSRSYASVYLVEGERTDTIRLSDHPPGRGDRWGVTAFLTFETAATPAAVALAVAAAVERYRTAAPMIAGRASDDGR